MLVTCNLLVTYSSNKEHHMSTITDLQEAIAGAADRVGPAVVGFGRGWGRGSGVVVAPGRVLTNAHNLRGEDVTVNFAGGRRETGTVAGSDADYDLAVVRVETGDVEPVAWDPDAAAATIGAPVVALANRGGRGLRATLGFVSSEPRDIRGPRGRTIRGCIEHTAPLPRGSGGGPLVDTEGRLIGLNTIRLEGGLIVAVPASAEVAALSERLWSGEGARRVRLGVALAPPRVARRMRRAVGLPEREGVLVRSVADGSPAAAAGIERGDLIVSAGGRDLERIDVLYETLDSAAPGDTLELGVVRGTEDHTFEVALQPEEVAT
jgi:S1-C subfamily serine protease